MSKIYIHYGNDHFDLEIMKSLISHDDKSRYWQNKCSGLWGSPVDCFWSWRDWCESEDFNTDRLDKSFLFALKPGSKVLYVESSDDVKNYIKQFEWFDEAKCLDFDKLKTEYDALEICHDKNYNDLHYSYFYSWDVDSILVWNQNVVVEVR